MERIELEINDDVYDAIKKIRAGAATEITLFIPENAVLFENSLNLKLLKKEVEASGKALSFETDDEIGRNLIELLDPKEIAKLDADTGFISQSREIVETSVGKKGFSFSFSKPSFSLPQIKFFDFMGTIKNPFKGKGVIVGIAAAVLFILFGYFAFWELPKARVSLVVNAQPLVKSITVKLSSEATSTDSDKRVLKGVFVDTSVTSSSQTDTTGEKLVGDKAKGEIEVTNKTLEDKKIKKGATVTYTSSKETLKFTTDEEIMVPKTIQDPPPSEFEPAPPPVYGKKSVKVTAVEFGSKYNIDSDKTIKIDGVSSSELIAKNDDRFSGGSSKTVKVVAEADKLKASDDLFVKIKGDALIELKGKLSTKQKLLDSTVTFKKGTEVYDKNVGDEAEKLALTQTIGALGMYYEDSELKDLLSKLLKEFVPDGYDLFGDESDIEVGVLTVPDGLTVVKELDLQVKIKTLIVPRVDEKEVRKNLKGEKIESARKYLSEIKNIESYRLDLWPKFSFILGRFPAREEKIEVLVEHE